MDILMLCMLICLAASIWVVGICCWQKHKRLERYVRYQEEVIEKQQEGN